MSEQRRSGAWTGGGGTIRRERDGDGVVTLVLDDPGSAVNTMNAAYRRSMAAVVEELERDRDRITGVVVTSAKRSFFAGGNLDELVRATAADRPRLLAGVQALRASLRRLETLGRPVVAAINGTALGGGLEIALACHHRVALDLPSIRLGLPEVTLGLMPGAGGVVRSVRLLGLERALTGLLLRGQKLRPDQALALGLVDELAADQDDLMARARAYIEAHPDAASGACQPYDVRGYRVPGGTPASPGLATVLPAFPATLVRQLKGAPYPAPHSILSAAVEGLQVDVETALTIENRYFVDVACGQVSTNMIQALWFDLNRVNGGAARPTGVPDLPPPQRVAVLGAGMMGAGIARVLAAAGLDVVLKDVDREAAEQGRDRIAAQLRSGTASDRRGDADDLLARITPAGGPDGVAGCDAVIEAVFEDEALKHRVFREVEHLLAPGALLCSNTSTLPITGLAAAVSRPEDFVGLHFFSPVHRMPLVEIVVGAATSAQTLARGYDLVRRIGKTPIVVGDSRGFFTSRVFATLVLESAALLGEGMAPMSVERAALQAGFPTGPLTLMDEVTLSLMLRISEADGDAATEAAGARTGARTDARTDARATDGDRDRDGIPSGPGGRQPHPGTAVVRTMVEHGRTGKAAGAGFFDWTGGKRLWPGLADLFEAPSGTGTDLRPPGADVRAGATGVTDAGPSRPGLFTEAQERMLFAMAVESVRCAEEGVLRSVEDGNVGSILGIGFPPLLGGVFQYVDQYAGGVAGFVARAQELADRHGERFRPPRLLTERALAAGSLRAALAG